MTDTLPAEQTTARDGNGLIQQWVQRNFTPMEVGRVEVYDLTK
jgi:hypothetical protein